MLSGAEFSLESSSFETRNGVTQASTVQPRISLARTTLWYSNQLQGYAETVKVAAEAAREAGKDMQFAYGAQRNPEGNIATSSQVRSCSALIVSVSHGSPCDDGKMFLRAT